MNNREEMLRAVIERIFPRRDSSKCIEKELCTNQVCRDPEYCCVDQKTDKQLEYILTPHSGNVFLSACPGSGKTEVVGMKAAFEFQAWKARTRGIAILTFTNNAAEVIRHRVLRYAGIASSGHPHFIGTMDSWLHGYVANPFGHLISGYQGRGKDETKDKSIRLVAQDISEQRMHAYQCKIAYHFINQKTKKPQLMPLCAHHLQYKPEQDSWGLAMPIAGRKEQQTDREYYESDGFKAFRSENNWVTLKALRRAFWEAKKKFIQGGFATYHDVECICYSLLRKHSRIVDRIARRFPFVIVDECQDLSWIQLEILGFLKNAGTNLHFVGDLNQAIYEFKQVVPEKVEGFVSSNGFLKMELSDNFRSCQEIVDVCSRIIPISGQVRGKEGSPLSPACILLIYKPEELSQLPTWFERYIENIRRQDKSDIQIERSAILARGRGSMVNRLRGIKDRSRESRPFHLAIAINLWSKKERGLWEDALLALGRFVADTYFKEHHTIKLRYYCPESITSPMRWRVLLARVLNTCLTHESGISDLAQPWEQWARLARAHFSAILDSSLGLIRVESAESIPPLNKLTGTTFRTPTGFRSELVLDSLTTAAPPAQRIRITTIHDVKGETFDAVLLVSAVNKKSEGGYWTQWLEGPKSEYARFCYVASSRPKRLLGWAIPTSKENTAHSKRIADLGFTVLTAR